MAEHHLLGQAGEEAAMLYLSQKGYRLHAHNWRMGHYELDIVAEWYGTYVFVEVKTRRSDSYGSPLEAIGREKIDALMKAARAYLYYNKLDVPFRFDVIAAIGTAYPFRIEHYENAFLP